MRFSRNEPIGTGRDRVNTWRLGGASSGQHLRVLRPVAATDGTVRFSAPVAAKWHRSPGYPPAANRAFPATAA